MTQFVSFQNDFHIDATDMPDFVSIGSPQISIHYYRKGYVSTLAQIFYESDDAERWFLFQPDNQSWIEIDPDQRWFWTSQWQEKEHQADTDLREGRYEDFEDLDDLFNL